jgi:hypothetical protein
MDANETRPGMIASKGLMARLRLAVWALIVLPVMAQFRSIVANKVTDSVTIAGEPSFLLYVDEPSPLPNIVAGYLRANAVGRSAAIGHRYFFDEGSHIYFGYDVVVQPQMAVDTYRVAFYELSIGPLDFQTDSRDALDPSLWKKVALPALPEIQLIRAGQNISVHVFGKVDGGHEFVDTMNIVPIPNLPLRTLIDGRQAWLRAHSMARSVSIAPIREASPASGAAHEFSLDDSEMRIQLARVTINGTAIGGIGAPRGVSGSLVWFYVPGHGRYVLSLTPRPDLGFVKAGEVRGGWITFTIGDDKVLLETPGMIAPGSAAYNIYVLHDAEWAPTARGQGAAPLFGSVAARELSAIAH